MIVSVIMPVFNAEKTLIESVNSVLAQSLTDFELILINDGSTDSSPTIAQQLMTQEPRILLLTQTNQGAPSARNYGISQAKGQYLCFLDADDRWRNDFLQKMSQALEREQQDFAYCGWQNVGTQQGEPFVPPDYQAMPDKKLKLIQSTRWPIHGVIVNRELVIENGMFNTHYRTCEDFALWLRLTLNRDIVRVPEVLAYYVHHSHGQQTDNRAQILLDHFQIQQDYFKQHPELVNELGQGQLTQLSEGHLYTQAMTAYWQGDLNAARQVFRQLMKRRYGKIKQWLYMLPSWLPIRLHQQLLALKRGH
ncbi:glycosyltransferase family 2 protein [Motilimonas sp. 1_MG-2023]|uniref:glycosyltransferase family 2 protein n=1 Tax=Motilimonas sp. 1_MG-2023 TaxID=3062672 RepID=UPI0026E3F200|nr:glycosyltransferase family 2 protein [Motilimonas sp. 1_MG-2023]MDO6524834.1 glycosyltransferase family 2 protein [Motilimonas sp. 1_MG-2023]